jgi:SAM-dependent methyltransferase
MLKLTEPRQSEARVVSFRDPAGRLLSLDDRILRLVSDEGVTSLREFLNSNTAREFLERGLLVSTRFIDIDSASRLVAQIGLPQDDSFLRAATLVEHERIPFQNFPYEWPPEMLYRAATLTLDLAESLMAEGLGLKDATPYNILFRGTRPVFVDVLSFEKRYSADPVWLALAQFERTFLLPLLVNKYFGISLEQLLTTRHDGLWPAEVYEVCGFFHRLRPLILRRVSIPTWLKRRWNQDDFALYEKKALDNPQKAQFIVSCQLARLRKSLTKLKPRGNPKSTWSDYLDSNNNYSQEHFRTKQNFVERTLQEFRPRRVLDVGCNTGHFSLISARSGASVVSIDNDPVVVGKTWVMAQSEALDILPLVVNLTRPTPAVGWRNQECASFLSRACGQFDAVLMLAVIHHMLVTDRIPLSEIIDLAAELTTDLLIIEFVSPADSMFRRLTHGRDSLFQYLTREHFEESCGKRFETIQSQHLEGTCRWLYLLKKKPC